MFYQLTKQLNLAGKQRSMRKEYMHNVRPFFSACGFDNRKIRNVNLLFGGGLRKMRYLELRDVSLGSTYMCA